MNTKYIISIGEILFDINPKKGILTLVAHRATGPLIAIGSSRIRISKPL